MLTKKKLCLLQISALFLIGVFIFNGAFPVIVVKIQPARADVLDDFELVEDDIATIAEQETENITYYIESSAMQAAGLWGAIPQVQTIDRLVSRMGTIPLFYDEAFPEIEQQFPMAAKRLLPKFNPYGTYLMAEVNKTTGATGETDVDLRLGEMDDYQGTNEYQYNMSGYDLSNVTLETKYASFSDYYTENSTAYDMDTDLDDKQALQIHYSGFNSFEDAWKDYVASLIAAEQGVSASAIHITDYDALDCNISTYFSADLVSAVREHTDDELAGESALMFAKYSGFGLTGALSPAISIPIRLPDVGKMFKISKLTTHLKFPNFGEAAKTIRNKVDNAWNDGRNVLNSIYSKGKSYVVGAKNFGQRLLQNGTTFFKKTGKWISNGVGKIAGFAGNIIKSPLFLILVALVLIAALCIGAFFLWKYLQGNPIPA